MEDQVFHLLESDEIFQQFLSAEFDAKAHATRIIQSHAISQQLARLAEGINLLDKELHSQVVAHHEDLLSQATGIETLDGVLHMMQTRIQSLLLAIERIRSRVVEPHNKIVTRTVQLRRLQETCDLLRHVIRVMYLSKRLQGQLQGGTREITKAAQSLNELDHLSGSVDLSGVEIIEADRRLIKQARKEVETQAQKMLEQGMEMQNQTQVATALQVFFSLNSLESTVDRILSSCKKHLRENVSLALDVNMLTQQPVDKKGLAPGRASGISSGNTATFRATLWMNMEKLVDVIYASYSQILHLQKVLIRKRDPVTHVLFADLLAQSKLEGSGNLLQDLWKFVTTTVAEEFNRTADNNSFLRQALEGEYPKLLRLFNELWRRIQSLGGLAMDMPTGSLQSHTVDESVPVDIENPDLVARIALDADYDAEKALRDTLSQFESAFLNKSLSRLIDPINLVFASNSASPPTDEEIEGIVRVLTSELNVAGVDAKLTVSMARNVAKTIVFFCTKSEQLLVMDSDGSQVIGPPTTGQTLNAAIVNSLFRLHHAVSKAVTAQNALPDAAMHSFHEALQGVVELMGIAIQPLLESVGSAIEAILVTMHDEDFSQPLPNDGATNPVEPQCSLYMRELQQFASRVASSYLAQFSCTDFIMQSVKPIACRCIELFVRHTSLLCPVGEGGKLRLATDYAQLEMALSPLCYKVSDLGRPYRLIRAISIHTLHLLTNESWCMAVKHRQSRPLLFQSAETVAKTSTVGDVISFSLVLHFLFARGYPALMPPYQTAGWSCSQYCQWLDEHSEKDRLQFIKASLESYVQSVTSRSGKEFTPVYPILVDLLQRGSQQVG